jgi:hypothetical protein
MDLQDVVAQEQFADYYEQNNLRTPEEKIGKLREVMKIIGIRCERGRKPEEVLAILEESALLGYWRAT